MLHWDAVTFVACTRMDTYINTLFKKSIPRLTIVRGEGGGHKCDSWVRSHLLHVHM